MTAATPTTPTVSVVIPVKDDAEQLRGCLRALSLQTRLPDEIVVVDNASTDDSAAVARAAGARVVRCDVPGIPPTAATGYDAATGDLILRLDADSRPGHHWVEAMSGALAARPDVAAYTGGARFVDGPRALRAPLAVLYLSAYLAVAVPALGHLPLFGSNLAMRASAWRAVRDRVHRDDPEVHDDFDLAFHLGERHRIRYLRDARMGVSMRPFRAGSGFGRRVRRGFRSVLVHWPADFPPVRWQKILYHRLLDRAGAVRPEVRTL
ncbi:glycosyltransferase family A protein [Microbacterium sp. zg.Y1084]|uniref:glycosyltransferase family A protein n=1 Tax=Microbacterium sp. zg.Y1084 TaxID=2969667 RepID=UPI00214D1301|nr:glycosyltransferase family A protein [Microbacterium sp. zg.Y1084]MCR2812684.1 glycosyltransferase family 2 protein [Microbacterium sp. zg.Y1084]